MPVKRYKRQQRRFATETRGDTPLVSTLGTRMLSSAAQVLFRLGPQVAQHNPPPLSMHPSRYRLHAVAGAGEGVRQYISGGKGEGLRNSTHLFENSL